MLRQRKFAFPRKFRMHPVFSHTLVQQISRLAIAHRSHRAATSARTNRAESQRCWPAAPLPELNSSTQIGRMTASTEVAVFTSSPCLSGSSLQTVMREHGFELGTLTVITSSATLQPAKTLQQAFQKAVSLATSHGHHNPAFLGLLAVTLKSGASLTVYEPAHSSEASAPLKKALLLAGFVDSTDRGLVQTAQGQHICVTANKPQYAVGAKAAITLKPKQQPKQTSWTLAVDDDDDDELLDEEELLTEEDRQKPAVIAADDCEVGAGKKACKNCTCGRADAEAAVQKVDLTQDMIAHPQSACGSCGLGDAFRCSTCPYRGLPSFEMGKKIELGSDFLTADA